MENKATGETGAWQNRKVVSERVQSGKWKFEIEKDDKSR